MRLSEVVRQLLTHLPPLGVERVSLTDAGGRVLAEPVVRACPDPPFTRSRVDGYAVATVDLASGGEALRHLTVAGTTVAGDKPPELVAAGTAWRVMAGAALGPGVGAVVPFEATPDGDRVHPGERLTLTGRPGVGENVIPAGFKGESGSLVLEEGTLVGPLEVTRLAGAGVWEITVRKRPQVTIRSSGSELVEPGATLEPGKVYASNSNMLSLLVAAWGGEVRTGHPVPDRLPEVARALAEGVTGAEYMILTGGVGLGDRDLTRLALAELEWPLLLDDASFLTGRSCAVARATGGQLVFLLPGGPESCLAAFTFLVAPALGTLAGRNWSTVTASLDGGAGAGELPLPVVLRLERGRLWARPRPHRSGMPGGPTATDGFLPPQVTGGDPDRLVDVWPVRPEFPLTGWPGRK